MDIAVIGAAGGVGRAVCTEIVARGLLEPGDRLQLVGRRGSSSGTGVFGLRIDLLDAYSARAPQVEPVVDAEQVRADIWVMVAGETPSHDPHVAASRDAVALGNLAVFSEYADLLAATGRGHEVVVIQSNPIELAVDVFASRWDRHRVLGVGAYNDTMRFRREVAADLVGTDGRAPHVTGWVMGEHGPGLLPMWSTVRAHRDAAPRLDALRARRIRADFPGESGIARAELHERLTAGDGPATFAWVQTLPPDVRAVVKPWFAHWTGSTAVVTAHAAVDVVAHVLAGERVVVPAQVKLKTDDWPGIDGVLGVPVDVDAEGWHRAQPVDLADHEHAALLAAADGIATSLATWRAAV